MTKSVLILLFLSTFSFAQNMNAELKNESTSYEPMETQSKSNFSLIPGLGYSSVELDTKETSSYDSQYESFKAFYASLRAEYAFSNHFQIQSGIDHLRTGFTYSDSSFNADLILSYLQIPMTLQVHPFFFDSDQKNSFLLGASLLPSFKTESKYRIYDRSTVETYDELNNVKSFVLFGGAHAGFRFSTGVDSFMDLKASFVRSMTDPTELENLYTQGFIFGASVGFGI